MDAIAIRKAVEKIGSREAYLATGIALAIDFGILAFSLCQDKSGNVDVGAIWSYVIFAFWLVVFGQRFGKRTARFISTHLHASWLAGIFCAFLTLWVASSVTGMFCWVFGVASFPTERSLDNFWLCAGVMPIVMIVYSSVFLFVHGIWFGSRIASKINEL
ncbi:hypothetical protein [Flavobacterium selenitireducens]|uniref:hypothetical protein n=1 Tax=Flavobacterium selenitireducens TaxID=2722704 RepID=UPI00168A7E16|nr:hypothetical protein [Flavobacterium selenitireducens]MBD3583693.1 hypothetical protein [Flavobacterium selenitireducens]